MTSPDDSPVFVNAAAVAPRAKASSYLQPFADRMAGREKRVIGDLFGLTNFGVNLTTLRPGAESSVLHRHTRQDELVYVLEGTATLVTETDEFELPPGCCAGFRAGGRAHKIVNRTRDPVIFLEIGDRTPDDVGVYPTEDLVAEQGPAGWVYRHKDGSPY